MHTGRHIVGRPPGHRSKTALAAGLLVVLVGTGGCSAGDSGGANNTSVAAADRSVASEREAGAPAAGHAGAPAAGQQDGAATSSDAASKPTTAVVTHVIRTATLEVQVKSVPKAVAAARSAAEGAGGLVADESTERIDDTHDMSHLVLRVPQDQYDAVLRSLAGSGKLLSRTSNAKDVTGQVVDVDSRIATQRASVARVRALMDKAERLADVVTLEGELSSRQAALESLLAQQASLKDRTSLATITLELSEPDAPLKDYKDGDPGFVDALGSGWDAFMTMLRWIAVAVGATAPFLAAGAVLLFLWRLLHGRLPRRRTAQTSPQTSPDPAAGPPDTPAP